MKTRLGLIFAALVGVLVWFAVPTAQAQPSIELDAQVTDAADTVLNGTVMSTTNVEIDGMPHRVSEVRVTSTLQGAPVAGQILVAVPGGERADGTGVFVSHTANLVAGNDVQLAVTAADPVMQSALPVALDLPFAAYSVVGGDAGALNVLPSGTSVASATGDFSHDGVAWPQFASSVNFYVNPAGSNLSASATISGARAGYAMWENDSASKIDFRYAGTTGASGVNFSDNRNTISWVNSPGANWLGQAWLEFDTNGVIFEFDIQMNRKFSWSNGAAGGRYDIATVVGHEVGHGLGFNHVSASSELMFGTIFSGTTKPLGSGDRSGARAIYPNPNFGLEPGHSVAANASADIASVHVKADGRLYVRTDIGSSASWEKLGAVDNWASADLAMDNAGNLQLVGLKSNGVLFTRYRSASGTWSGWVQHSGIWSTDTMPSIATNATGSSVLAAVSSTGQLRVKTGSGSLWSAWQTQGAGGWAQVDADIANDGDIWFVGVKSSGNLYVRKDTGSGWSGFKGFGLATWSADTPPSIGAYSNGVVFGAVKDDGRLFTRRQNNGVWYGWGGHGIDSWSAVDLTVSPTGELAFVGTKSYGRMFLRTQLGGQWSGWTKLGQDTWSPIADASVAFIRGDDPILVGVKGNGIAYLRQRVNSTWLSWQALGAGGWATGN